MLFVALFVAGFASGAAGSETGDAAAAVGLLIGLAVWGGYFLVLEGLWDGYSVGKKVVGIKVVTDSGESCTVTASVVRNLLDFIDQLPLLYLLGLLFIGMSDNHKRLGDIAAGTVVVTDTPR